jgi:hypothetical protein
MFEGIGILTSVATALMSSFITYVSKKSGGKEDVFDGKKFSRTMSIGLVAGVTAYLVGFELTPENYAQYLGANAGVIHFGDQISKFAYRLIMKK